MNPIRALALACILLAGPAAFAEDPGAQAPEGPKFSDIVTMLKDKNAQYKQDKIQEAVQKSVHTWRPKDVYELLDLGASPPVLAAAAAKATMFWDGSAKAIAQVQQEGRDRAAAEKITVRNNDELVIVFEHFNEIKHGVEAARKALGPLQPRQGYEDDLKYDMRKREYDVKLAAALAPFEGQISKTTFDIEVTGGFTAHDGKCTQALVEVDLSRVSFELFRYGMGGLRVDVPIQVAGNTNVESARWTASGTRRFEAKSKPICVSAAQASTLASQGSKLKITLSRPFDSDKWTGTGSFVNAKTNARL